MLYPASGFNGGNGFGTITKIGYDCNGSFFSGASIPIKIYIMTVGTTTTLSGSTWNTAISGATLVYSGSFFLGTAGGWCDITLTTPFTWSSGNLEVLVENDWTNSTTTVGDPNWNYNSSANTDVNWTSNTSAAALGTSSACCATPDQYRADIRLTVTTVTCTAPTTVALSGFSTPICSGTSPGTFTATPTGGSPSTYTYLWYQDGASTGVTTATFTPGNLSTNSTFYCAVSTGTGCTTNSPDQIITVDHAPALPGNIIGPAGVCDPSTNIFSVAPVSGATSYTWTLPGGWSGTSLTDSISATEGSGGGNITVTANNGCGNSQPQTLAVSVIQPPATPGTISGPDSLCPGMSREYSVVAVGGATNYTWTLPGTWSGTSTVDSILGTAGLNGGTITVTASNNCGVSQPASLVVNIPSAPSTPTAIMGPDSACAGTSNLYLVSPVSGASSYTWTLPGTWTGSSSSDSITALVSTSGDVMVTTNGTCGSSVAQSLSVVINPAPNVTFNFTQNPICNTATITLTGGSPAGGTYSGQGVSGNTFDASTVALGNYEITYSYTSVAGCTGVDSAVADVTVCTGISNISSSYMALYPNPFGNELVVAINGSVVGGQLVLTDAVGREVARAYCDNNSSIVKINTASMTNGAYLLQLIADGKTISTHKVFRME
ncbi:MAG: hypothetical protein JWO06_1014 [Bacteroidota bacterium]|nr:hypothetical protein [Bacteroidota bacterium]